MIEQNLIEEPIFSFYMDRTSKSVDSKLIFGSVDRSLIDGEINYHKVTETMFWSIACEKILVGEEDTEICTKN